jgi:hypothetical protein
MAIARTRDGDAQAEAAVPAQGTRAANLGFLPVLSVVASTALLVIALADMAARAGMHLAALAFWIGLLLLLCPIAGRLLSSGASGVERIGLVVLLGMALYGVKLLHSPTGFTFVDELQHMTTANAMLGSGHLFGVNSILPVSSLYPSSEIIADALDTVGGLPLFASGVILMAAARLILMLALFLYYRQVGGSARIAGLGVLIYMANPNFLYFDAQFSYESLALPLAVLVLYALARRVDAQANHRIGLTAVLVLVVAMVVTTHHMTSYVLALLALLWAVLALLKGGSRAAVVPAGVAALTIVLALAWLSFVATLTISYLDPTFRGAAGDVVQLILRESGPRQLFHSSTGGYLAPTWERLTGFGAIICILAGLPFGWLCLWRARFTSPPAAVHALATLIYPATLFLRLTAGGAEISNRASEFIFVPMAYVLATGIVEFRVFRWLERIKPLALVPWVAIIFAGGLIIGWPPWARQPGPYLVGADSRSIEPQGIDAAEWAARVLGPGHRVAADRTNTLLMSSYGRQYVVTHLEDNIDVSGIYFSSSIGSAELDTLRAGRIRFVIVDMRLSTAVPQGGPFFEMDANDSRPIPAKSLQKFDHFPLIDRVFDSGSIAIYNTAAVSNAP